ncbi:UvrD-helicase domain-containing protein [Candidatus Kinetoplastidibacterium crithidiae]|uniref:DNA 3'-5' helicase n=1 Tax=Candidatus Kinetoplastidibacterium crithidiae TCC036E TaxID=1208918 RepID=M1LTK2_9PROT|nr:UvrD-helicase domain-containing protein [Candidatus Kinetoplastibacterium crithidii]AFZ83156.1 UvrD/Rep helicase family protein 2 [Candidatus Kinetoplastibacterium crithidii (ex Angomonas deanei ATCC 30255)]AGF47431.1 UvrD/Rep helicase [Candidatus Kinetoplastibacterium crithidii TCC036E]
MSENIKDFKIREEALNIHESFIVQAPAGSGKTELLTNRFLALLSNVLVPEEIVAITFTRKAANEMRRRIIERLQIAKDTEIYNDEPFSLKLSREVLKRDSLFGWNILQHPARLMIKTFDSFCAQIVSNLPWLSRMGGLPVISSDMQFHYDSAAKSTIALIDKFDYVKSLLLNLDLDINFATRLISDMLKKRDQWLPILRYGLDKELIESNLKLTIENDISRLLKELPENWQSSIQEPIRIAAKNLYKINPNNVLEPLLDWDYLISNKISDLRKWKAIASLFLTAKKTLRSTKSFNKSLGFDSGSSSKEILINWLNSMGSNSSWVSHLAMISYAPDPFLTDKQWRDLTVQLKTLSLSVANLILRFNNVSEVDFIEITQRASIALGSDDYPNDLLLKLDNKINHILIDEFQDTSRAHFDIIKKLISGWQNDDGRTLFLVGDPMQSIYSFRKAEVGLFLQVIENGIGCLKPKHLKLVNNFRSHPIIVNWINGVFKEIFPNKNDEDLGAVSYTDSVTSLHDAPDSLIKFHCVQGTENREARLAQTAINIIQETINNYGINHTIAVLVRSRNNINYLTSLMSQNNIRFRSVDIVPLANKPVVSDLLQLIRALKHPGDRLAWLSILRSPFFGLTLDNMHKLFGNDHKTPVPFLLNNFFGSGNSEFDLFDENQMSVFLKLGLTNLDCMRLFRLKDLLSSYSCFNNMSPALFIQSLWNNLGGSSVYSDKDASGDAELIFDLIDESFPYGEIDIEQLERKVNNLYASSNVASKDAVVDIMTIHKAKGLEFDSVLLYGLHQSMKSDQEPLIRFESNSSGVLFSPAKPKIDLELDKMSSYLKYRNKVKTSYELDRLLYVAATRSKKNLHLISSVVVDDDGKIMPPVSDSLLSRLCNKMDIQNIIMNNDILDENQNALASKKLGNKLLHRVSTEGISILDKNRKNLFLKYNDAYHKEWSRQHDYQSILGTVMHFWLNRIGIDSVNLWNINKLKSHRELIYRQLIKNGIPYSKADEYTCIIFRALENTLTDDRGIWLLSHHNNSHREWSLVDSKGIISVLDLAIDLGDKWLIVDYKLSDIKENETYNSFINRIKQAYIAQLTRYRDALNKFDGRKSYAAIYCPLPRIWIECC